MRRHGEKTQRLGDKELVTSDGLLGNVATADNRLVQIGELLGISPHDLLSHHHTFAVKTAPPNTNSVISIAGIGSPVARLR